MDERSAGYQIFMLVLCVYSLVLIGMRKAIRYDPAIQQMVDYADFMVCMVFLGDFAYNLWRAKDRMAYLKTWGWIDLASSIPSVDAARWGRLARILRVFRFLRGLRTTRLLTQLILRRRAENAFLAVSLVAIMFLAVCSIAVLYFESDSPDASIRTAEDALWWGVTTMTTVGYGDLFPVTTEGRVVAVLLMAAGVGLFGTLSGFLAAWLMGERRAEESADIDGLKAEIAVLRGAVEALVKDGGPPRAA